MNKKLKKIIPLLMLSTSFYLHPFVLSEVHASGLGSDVPIVAEFKDTSLVDTLDALSKLSDIPIIIHGKLTDKVTLNTNGQDLSSILSNLSKAFNFTYIEKDGMIVVSDKDTMRLTETFDVKYMDMDELKSDIKTFLDTDKASTSIMDNTVTVSGTASDIERVREILNKKDIKQKQVTIQAKLIEISKSEEEKLGLTYGWNSFDSTTSWKFAYTTSLTASGTDNTGKVIARPTVATLSGKEATINLTDQVPILTTTTSNNTTTTTVDYKEVGVKLKVTPRVNADGLVTMNVDPTVSTITKTIETNNVYAPQISSREVSTNVRVKSGDAIIIGGLLKKDDLQNISKIPVLGDLPILGKLFQNKTHQINDTELIVVITPIVENDEDFVTNYNEQRMQNTTNKETMQYMEKTDRRGNQKNTDKK